MFSRTKNILRKAPNVFAKTRITRGLSRIERVILKNKKEKSDKIQDANREEGKQKIEAGEAQKRWDHAQNNFGNQWGEPGSYKAEEHKSFAEREAKEAKEEATRQANFQRAEQACQSVAEDTLKKIEKNMDMDMLVQEKDMEKLIPGKAGIDDTDMVELNSAMKKDVKYGEAIDKKNEEENQWQAKKDLEKAEAEEDMIEKELESIEQGNVVDEEEVHEEEFEYKEAEKKRQEAEAMAKDPLKRKKKDKNPSVLTHSA